jgi:hypothetical protein
MHTPAVVVFALCVVVAFLLGVRGQTSTCPATSIATNGSAANCPCPDVFLDVPNLSVEEIKLTVDNLTAHVDLNVRLSSLLTISAGVDVSINKVNLEIKGVKAELELDVRLGNVVKILDRALTTLDRNPNLLSGVINSVGGLLSSVLGENGLVQRVVDSLGNVVERVVSDTGAVLSQTVVGAVQDLQRLSRSVNSLGQIVDQVVDSTGAVIEVVYDTTGAILSTKVIKQATNTAV